MRLCYILLATFVCQTLSAKVPWTRSDTCDGRCGEMDGTTGCQCNELCLEFDDCCEDFEDICYTCEGRCNEGFIETNPCHCNDECSSHGNCCDDYDDFCEGVTGLPGGPLSDDDLRTITSELMTLDDNNVASQLTINHQGLTTQSDNDDVAPDPLLTVPAAALTGPTLAPFMALRDNYDSAVEVTEDNTAAEQTEQQTFLDAIMSTRIMIRTEEFMSENGLISGPLRDTLDLIWFHPYSRSGGPEGSSGFEHSFMGEIKNSDVSGFHNWVSFSKEEENQSLDYKGYIAYSEYDNGDMGEVMNMRFVWDGHNKPISSMFIGTSPEYELAVYTICFFTRPNSQCTVASGGVNYTIQTYTLDWDGFELVGSAYPDP